MSNFLYKSLLFRRNYDNCVRNPFVYNPLSLRWLSSSVRVGQNEHSFTVSYLINSLGFSLEASKLLSNHVNFKTSLKPDKAIDFLRSFGFTQTQIPKLVRAYPQVLLLNPNKIILPKLEFLESKGISRHELTKSLSAHPTVLGQSLAKKIKPTFEYLRTLLPSEAKIALAIKRYPDILVKDIEKYVSPNVSALRRIGVPDSNISKLIYSWPRYIALSSVLFRETIEEVSEMGFSPSRFLFFVAVIAKANKANWESKVNMYKKWGWSDKDILKAFLSDPWCMCISEDRFTSVMNFFILEMGFKPCDLAKTSAVFKYNLKTRVVPRVLVSRALVSKGLMEKHVNMNTLIFPIEKDFLRKYVTPYANAAPELLKLYNEAKK